MTSHVHTDAPATDPTPSFENGIDDLRQWPCVLCVRLSAIGDVVMLGRSLQALHESRQNVILVTEQKLLPVVSLFPSVRWALTISQADDHLQPRTPKTGTKAHGKHSLVLKVWHRPVSNGSWESVPLTSVISVLAERRFFDTHLIDFQCTARSHKACKALRKAGLNWNKSYSVPKKTLYRASRVLWSRLVGSPCHAQTRTPADLRTTSASTGVVARQLATVSRLKKASTPQAEAKAKRRKLVGQTDTTQTCSPALPAPSEERSGHEPEVLLFSGASLPLKRWPLENCLSFARALLKKGHSLALLGGPDEKDFGDQIARLVPGVKNLAGQCSLTETFSHIQASRFVVTTDSFPAHVCDLMHKHCIVLFGSTSPDFGFAPLSPTVDTLYSGYSCSPCTRHGRGSCRFGQTPCMRAHRGDDIADRVDQHLRKNR